MSSSRTRRLVAGGLRSLRAGTRLPLCVTWELAAEDDANPAVGPEQALDLIDEMAAAGTGSLRLGGDQLLARRDLRALVQRVRYHAIGLVVEVSPTPLPKRIKHLDGCDGVCVNVAPADALDVVRRALRTVAERGWRRSVRLMLTSATSTDRLEGVLRLCDDLGASLQPVPHGGPTPTVGDLKAVRALLDRAIELSATGHPGLPPLPALHHLRTWPAVAPIRCAVDRFAVTLDAAGLLHPCHEHPTASHGVSVLSEGFLVALSRLRGRACFECWGPERVAMRAARWRGPAGVMAAHRDP